MQFVENGIRALDHFVYQIRDLDESGAHFEHLGFHVRPTAKHVKIGSSNKVVIFDTTYLELFNATINENIDSGLLDEVVDPYYDFPKHCQGLCHIALTSEDLDADKPVVADLGFEPLEIMNAKRLITYADGTTDFTESRSMYMWRYRHTYMSMFISDHPKPEAIFIQDYNDHANGARCINRMVFVSDDPTFDLNYFSKLFGKKPDESGDWGFTITGWRGDKTDVLTREEAEKRYPGLINYAVLDHFGGGAIAMHMQTTDLAQTRQYFQDKGIEAVERDGSIALSADVTQGSAIIFQP